MIFLCLCLNLKGMHNLPSFKQKRLSGQKLSPDLEEIRKKKLEEIRKKITNLRTAAYKSLYDKESRQAYDLLRIMCFRDSAFSQEDLKNTSFEAKQKLLDDDLMTPVETIETDVKEVFKEINYPQARYE
jgi:hypothetical protein